MPEDHIPSRRVLTEAGAANIALGHENFGFLSESAGLIPALQPQLFLPETHKAWDEVAEDLPTLFQECRVRHVIDSLPSLSVGEADLPDTSLLRAAHILGILGHSYRHAPHPSSDPIPKNILVPWRQVNKRLGHPRAHLSYIDLIIYNWKLLNPKQGSPKDISDMRLLTPTVGNEEEHVFYLTQVEILAQCSPVIGAAIRCQEAVVRGDSRSVERELRKIGEQLDYLTRFSLPKIDPRSYVPTYVNPVVWAKTVAPFAVPFEPGVVGPSGTASPIFHVLDAFFNRPGNKTRFGHEMLRIRDWYPIHWKNFIEALEVISTQDYVHKSDDESLKSTYDDVYHSYVSNAGFLGRHRLKVYGYLGIAFRVGRETTIGGFHGELVDHAWDEVDNELLASRFERGYVGPRRFRSATMKSVRALTSETSEVFEVVLDVSNQNFQYSPGDRCQIQPANPDWMIERALTALTASAETAVRPTSRWSDVLRALGIFVEDTVPLRVLLRYGCIRSLEGDAAENVLPLVSNERAHAIYRTRPPREWSLWSLIRLLRQHGLDPARLWDDEHSDMLARLIVPEPPRSYSISKATKVPEKRGFSELHLIVERLKYYTWCVKRRENIRPNIGIASHFLTSDAGFQGEEATVPFQIVPGNFHLPDVPGTPMVMFAAGTGFAPFRSIIDARRHRPELGDALLFLGFATEKDILYRDELDELIEKPWFDVSLALSRDDHDVFIGDHHEVSIPGKRHRIGEEILRGHSTQELRRILAEGAVGRKPHFYMCGSVGFVNSVKASLNILLLDMYASGELNAWGTDRHAVTINDLCLMEEMYSSKSLHERDEVATISPAELAVHNNDRDGTWLAVSGQVYDASDLLHTHRGGAAIIRAYAGLDATAAFDQVEHNDNIEAVGLLRHMAIGALRQVPAEWRPDAIYPSPASPRRRRELSVLWSDWASVLYLVAELENVVRLDFSIRDLCLTSVDEPGAYNPLRIALLCEIHTRFCLNLEGLYSRISALVALTDPTHSSRASTRLVKLVDSAQKLVDELTERVSPGCPEARFAGGIFEAMQEESLQVLDKLKRILCVGFGKLEEGGEVDVFALRKSIRHGLSVVRDYRSDQRGALERYVARAFELKQIQDRVNLLRKASNMPLLDMLRASYSNTNAVLEKIPADQWETPSKCAGWTIREVADHMNGSFMNMASPAAKDTPPAPKPHTDDEDASIASVRSATEESLRIFSRDGVLDATFDTPMGPVTGRVLASISLLESVVHTWDICEAAGVSYMPDSSSVAELHECLDTWMGEQMGAQVDAGLFQPSLDSESDNPFHRLLARTGRRTPDTVHG